MKPRPYQLECFERLRKENTIVNMPTGTGKTLVAVLAIDHFRESGKAIFLVPTRALVSQQAEYVRQNIAKRISVAELEGTATDHLTAPEWKEIISGHDVLVGTTEVFRRALVDTKFLHLRDFSLLIFDECHNAVGNSPMAALLRDAVHRSRSALRILGLTASFVHGSLKDIEKKRRDLEGLMQSTIFCPDVEERQMEFVSVDYEVSLSSEQVERVERQVEALVDVAVRGDVPVKDTSAIIRRGVHVFSELGKEAFVFYLQECVAPQLQVHLQQVAEVKGCPSNAHAVVNTLGQVLKTSVEQWDQDGSLAALPSTTGKVQRLLELLAKLRKEMGSVPKAIVFCEQTALIFPLARLLQTNVKCRVGACMGVGAMTDSQRTLALQQFKAGEIPLLVCTSALEEGLDVSECQIVIRFSQFATTKSHIQGAGRARKWGARVYYFENDPDRERKDAELLRRTATEQALSLSAEEMRRRRKHRDLQDIHPFRSHVGAEISLFNCVQIVYEFVQRTMKQSFRPEESMLSYEEETVSSFPPMVRSRLTEVRVPSPDGVFTVHADAVNAFWGGVDVSDVADPSRTKNWDNSKKELRRHLYVVAVQLSEKGYLDERHQPTGRALNETVHRCPAWPMEPGVKIGVRYGGARQSVVQTRVESRAEAASSGQATTENFKGQLNELTRGQATYSTEAVPHGFVATVEVPGRGCWKSQMPASSKKAAEQLAARAACAGLA